MKRKRNNSHYLLFEGIIFISLIMDSNNQPMLTHYDVVNSPVVLFLFFKIIFDLVLVLLYFDGAIHWLLQEVLLAFK